jgi:histidinol-phosphate aminotransferase
MNFDLERLVRRNIRDLKPYSSARSEFSGAASIFLDANENSLGSPAGPGLNRYPDPLQLELKQRIAETNGLSTEQIFVGNGSDEAIDLLFRVFCEPGRDACVVCPPTYGMYEVSAAINDVRTTKVPLTRNFHLDTAAVLAAVTPATKLLFVCSPNNPTGNLMDRSSVIELAEKFPGLVVIDEAYIHLCKEPSFAKHLDRFPNLVVLQTFSKAWGMAGMRVGTAFASVEIVQLLNRVKPPYNVSTTAQETVLQVLEQPVWMEDRVSEILIQRSRLECELRGLPIVQRIYPSDSNFVLVKTANAKAVYRHLIERGIVVRNRSSVTLCEGCLRITVGTGEENDALLSALKAFPAKTEVQASA